MVLVSSKSIQASVILTQQARFAGLSFHGVNDCFQEFRLLSSIIQTIFLFQSSSCLAISLQTIICFV
jgi:hypothetical protein